MGSLPANSNAERKFCIQLVSMTIAKNYLVFGYNVEVRMRITLRNYYED